MGVKYKKTGTWYDISSSSNNVVDAVENGNLNPVTSNAVYDALPTFEQYIFPLTFTVAAGSTVEVQTNIPWSNDIVVIPRWNGTSYCIVTNYYNSNSKVRISLLNTSSMSVSLSAQRAYYTVIRSKVNWS